MNLNHLSVTKQKLEQKREELLGRFGQAARGRQKAQRLILEIHQTNEFLESLEQIQIENARFPQGPRRYLVSSWFLHECFKKLVADQNEQFFFITGTEVEGMNVLDQLAEFAHQRRTQLGVVGHMPSTHNLLIRLEQFGHKFLAHFHSHPGTGADSTRPSGTDENFQRRLEQAGHSAIMAIFSRDGFVRFVRLENNFEVEIYGQGVEKYGPAIFRLTNVD
jgi:hypothetical protein